MKNARNLWFKIIIKLFFFSTTPKSKCYCINIDVLMYFITYLIHAGRIRAGMGAVVDSTDIVDTRSHHVLLLFSFVPKKIREKSKKWTIQPDNKAWNLYWVSIWWIWFNITVIYLWIRRMINISLKKIIWFNSRKI